MTLSEGIDLVYALMLRAQDNINLKPEFYRPVYHLYYMIIYVAIQDSFNYGKVKSKSKDRTSYRWRNKRSAKQRIEAREWLLESEQCKRMWEHISGIDYEFLRKALVIAFTSFKDECNDQSDWNRHNDKSIEIGRRLKGLSI